MTVQVRALAPADHPRVLKIARALAAWFRPLDQMALSIDLRKHQGLVVTEGAQIAGFLTYHLVTDERAEISWFGVLPALQSQGIGGQLLEALEEQMRERGVTSLQLSTVPAEHDATFTATNRFYAHRGFTIRERDDHFYAYGRPGILLEKQISDR